MRIKFDALHVLAMFATCLRLKLGRNRAHEELADHYAKSVAVGASLLHSSDPAHQALVARLVDEHDAWIARTSYELLSQNRAGILALVRATINEAEQS